MPDQKLIVLYLARKGMNTTRIHQDLFTTLALDALLYPTVTGFLREMFCTHEQLPAQGPAIQSDSSAINLTIAQALNDEPFTPVLQPTKRKCLPKSTVYYHLVNSLGFTTKHLRWVLGALSQGQKQVLIEMPKTSSDRCTRRFIMVSKTL
jgi:hypothetical protein